MTRDIRCMVLGHKVDDGRVRTPDDEVTGRCRWCGRRVEQHGNGWKLRTRGR